MSRQARFCSPWQTRIPAERSCTRETRARAHTRTHRERHTHKHKEKSDAVNIREPRQIKESKGKRKNGGSNPTALSRLFNPLYISAAAAGTRTQRTGGDDEALQGGVLQLSARTHYRNTLPTLTSEPLGIIIIIIIVVIIIIIIIIKNNNNINSDVLFQVS